MNKEILRQLGFSQEIEAVENRICPFCHLTVNTADFTDDISLREYQISGLCNACQNEVFREPEDDEVNYDPYEGRTVDWDSMDEIY